MSFPRAVPGGASTGAKLTSTQFNALDTDHSVSTSDAQYSSGLVGAIGPGHQWYTETGMTGPITLVWNDTASGTGASAQQWAACGGVDSNTVKVVYGTGNDNLWTPLAATVATTAWRNISLAFDSAGAMWLSTYNTTTGNVYKLTAGGGTFSLQGGFSPFTGATDFPMVIIGTSVIMAAGSTNNTIASVGNFSAGNYNPVVTPGGTAIQKWILRSNGTTALALQKLASGSINIYSTVNGTSWTTTSMVSVLASSDIPIDIAWSPYQQKWLLAVNSTGSGHTSFLTSTNGTTWTATGTTLSNVGTVQTVAALGAVWVAACTAGVGNNNGLLITSPDGVTWVSTPGILYGVSGYSPRLYQGTSALCGTFLVNDGLGNMPLRFTPQGSIFDVAVS